MTINEAAFGRQARTVRILTNLAVLVQDKNTRIRCGKKKTQKVYLPHVTLIIRYTDSGETIIETEPP